MQLKIVLSIYPPEDETTKLGLYVSAYGFDPTLSFNAVWKNALGNQTINFNQQSLRWNVR